MKLEFITDVELTEAPKDGRRPRKSPDAISAGCFFLLLFLCAKEKVGSLIQKNSLRKLKSNSLKITIAFKE